MEKEQENKGFTIKDRRIFSSEPENQKEVKKDIPAKDIREEAKEEKMAAAEVDEHMHQLPEANFATHIIALASNAILYLGDMENPMTGKLEQNLPAAKHTIDTIAMLAEKTKGNLEADEKNMIDNILYDLRMRYVNHTTK